MSKSKLVDKIGQFTTIPNSVMALWPTIGTDAMALFVYLRYRTNSQTGDAFPSFDTIGKDTGMRRERIARAIRALESAGLVERKRRFSASTIYTLKMPDAISPTGGLMENAISPTGGLPLVRQADTNQIEIIKTESNTSRITTRDIQTAYLSCVNYPVDWRKNEGHAAKWLSENGYTPEDVTGCYKAMKDQPFWKDKPLSLSSIKNAIGEWKSNATKRKVIVINA